MLSTSEILKQEEDATLSHFGLSDVDLLVKNYMILAATTFNAFVF